jgi:hypothetical protein
VVDPDAKNFVVIPLTIKTFELAYSRVIITGSLSICILPSNVAVVLEAGPNVTSDLI